MLIHLQYDPKTRQGVITGDYTSEIREYFSVENVAAKFNRHNPWIPHRKYAITPTGRFEVGLLKDIVEYSVRQFSGVDIIISPELKQNVFIPIHISKFTQLKQELRYYQADIVDECLKQGRGTVVLATAGGKTLTIASLINSFYTFNKNLKCLIIVPNLGLVNQTFNDFSNYRVTFSTSKWTGSEKLNLGTNCVIANLGILQSKCSDLDWIQDIDLLIIDEVHQVGSSNKINKIIKKIKTNHKFGFTGTLPDSLLDKWNIIGKIGPVLYEKKAVELEKENYVSPVKSLVLKLHYKTEPEFIKKKDIISPTQKYRRELEFLFKNDFRNKTISQICNNLDNNCLVLVDFIEHGETLFKILTEYCKNKQVFFIKGEVEVEDRKKITDLMEREKNVVCIAISKIFSVGISILNLHYIAFVTGGKAKVKTIQSIGRGRRLHKDKQVLILLDFADQLTYGIQHMEKRLNLYKQEEIAVAFKDVREK